MDRFTKKVYNSSGTWTCPAGVTSVIVMGMGGGASGAKGSTGSASYGEYGGVGGCASNLVPLILDVVPNTTYTITIGAGGAISSTIDLSNAGGDTIFGALATFKGAPGRTASTSAITYGTSSRRGTFYGSWNDYINQIPTSKPAIINSTPRASYPSYSGQVAFAGYSGPTEDYGFGGNAGMGGLGPGANGGDSAASAVGGAGASAAANTGAGGGGGAGGGSTSKAGGNGGAGGSGQLTIMWVE